MSRVHLAAAATAFIGLSALSAPFLPSSPAEAQARSEPRAGGSLVAFRSDAELRAYLRGLRQRVRAQESASPVSAGPPPPAPPPPPAASMSADAVQVTGSRVAKADAITNTQEAGVDEGGIVKKRGDLLIVLRRGRLFTVSVAKGGMRPVDMIDAMPPGVDGSGDWYDEMLINGDQVIVVGYSYRRGGTEINRFRLSSDGHLAFRDAYHLRSNDYYSSRNYASRLIGNRLIYYTPLYLNWNEDPFEALPAIRRWNGSNKTVEFRPVADAHNVFIVPRLRDDPEAEIDTLHSVMDCDLTAPVLDCNATVVLGPASRNFYVSPSAVYLWVSDAWSWNAADRGGARSFLYRMPFGRERPSAIAARGAPTDQFSFREDPRAGLVDILVRGEGGGDSMWNPEVTSGDVALLSVPIRFMGNGSREVPLNRYRQLPSVGRNAWNFQNRFVGNHILYGGKSGRRGEDSLLVAAALRGGPISTLELPHSVERIDILGNDGVVIGNDSRSGLHFTAVDLRLPSARVGNSFRMPDAEQGESRSHAFFYRADDDAGANGVLGLPITRSVEPQFRRFLGNAASILFLRRDDRRFALAGEMDAQYRRAIEDNCQASCVDWYGNARPIFAGDRIFALLGYELVEGRMDRGRIREIDRVSYAPGPYALSRR